MKPSVLAVGIEKGVEAIETVADRLATLERTREELNATIDASRSELHETRGSATAIGFLDTLTDAPEAEVALLKNLLVTGTSSHTGANNLERLIGLNETLEALRGLYSSGPCLVLSNYLNPSYPDRQKGIVFASDGNLDELEVVERSQGFYFEDGLGDFKAIYTRLDGHGRLSSDFDDLHTARVSPSGDVQVFRGEEAIRQAVAELKDVDITAFFVAVMKTYSFVHYDDEQLAIPEDQKQAIVEALVRNIAVASIGSAQSEAHDSFRVKEILGEHKIDPAHEQYLQLARYYLDHPDFYDRMGEFFGEEFERGALLSNAFSMQSELLSGRGRIITPLGTISLACEMTEWPNGLQYPRVPLPTSKGGGLS